MQLYNAIAPATKQEYLQIHMYLSTTRLFAQTEKTTSTLIAGVLSNDLELIE